MYRCSWCHASNSQPQVVRSGDGLPVELGYDVAPLQPGFRAWTVVLHVANQCSLLRRNVESLSEVRCDFLNPYANVSAHHFPVLQNLIHHMLGHVDGNGEADTLITARASGKNRGVDSDQLATNIQQCASGVPGIDGGVGLNEILVVLN